MILTDELVTQFVRATDDSAKESQEATVYGTIVEERQSGKYYVRLDGAPEGTLTPVASTAICKKDDRVIVRIQNHQATIVGNVGSPSASNNDLNTVSGSIADKVSTAQLEAERARIKDLETKTAVIEELIVTGDAELGDVIADNVEIREQLNANKASIDELAANKLDTSIASATYATIANLDATNTKVYNLETTFGDINTLIFGSATGDTIQTSFANAVIAQLGDAQIKSAMIDSVSASQIKSGDIITNNVRVMSEDGKLIISDETLQISDANRVRVQIGKDAEGDYSINIWDQNGNLMFSKGGITDSAIKDAIIRNDMISDTANISAHKLDIDSLFEEINDSDKTIKSAKIYLDDEEQTLDVAFKSMTETVEEQGETITSHGTAISTIQGQITSKIWQQDIDTAKGEMSTQYTTLEQDINGFKTMVSSTYATKTALAQTQSDIDKLDVVARNLFTGYGEQEVQLGDYQDTGSFLQFVDCLSFDPTQTVGETYTISFWAKSPNGPTSLSIYNQNGQPRYFYFALSTLATALGDEWEYFTRTVTNVDMGETYTGTAYNRIEFYAPAQKGVLVKKIKVERGDRATDWTPAPEDMATVDDAQLAQSTAEAAQITATTAESLVQQLSESISMLVTDGNGTSLMTQTDEGWTFSTAEIQTNVSNLANDLDALTGELGSTSHTVDVLKQAVDDLGEIAEYVKIGTYEDEPCIELGESDSEFKMRITNTRILFMEGSNIVAHITNQSLHIKKAVVEEELQQGGFVWQVRSNGNMGLIWKGVSS